MLVVSSSTKWTAKGVVQWLANLAPLRIALVDIAEHGRVVVDQGAIFAVFRVRPSYRLFSARSLQGNQIPAVGVGAFLQFLVDLFHLLSELLVLRRYPSAKRVG